MNIIVLTNWKVHCKVYKIFIATVSSVNKILMNFAVRAYNYNHIVVLTSYINLMTGSYYFHYFFNL